MSTKEEIQGNRAEKGSKKMKKALRLILCLLTICMANSNSIYAGEVSNSYFALEDDPQAGKEDVIMLDNFSDADFEAVGQRYGFSLFSIPSGYVHNAKFDDCTVINGIDVSYYQGDINWNAVKADGIDFAIIRVGYRGYGTSGNLREDPKYVQNIQGALNAGVKVGVYIFSQATTTAEAVEEANFLLSRIGGYNISFPVVMDFEYASLSSGEGGRLYDANLSQREATEVCKAFASRVASAGYTPMIYANKSMLRNHLYANELSAVCDIWLANYVYQTDYEGDYTCWQYTSGGSVAGISGRVDMNFWYDKPSTVYRGVDYASVYNFDYYMSTYSDLRSAYANNAEGALAHFVNFGMSEGRQGSEEFNVHTYRARYADLRSGFGNDLKGYYLHYLNHGKTEGRSGAGTATLVPITTYQGIDYSAVYNYDYYRNKYSDLATAYDNDDYALLQHFVESGMAEGRQASEEFNVHTYKNRYIDLRRGYKNDLKGYYMHYILSGKAEGRSGAGEATLVGETVYQGVDYAAVYSFEYYMNKYPDLASAFGSDEYGALQHFVEHGMAEGRQGSAEFNVIAYRNRYDDLRAGYGNDNKGYYLHYLYSGKVEGRDGSDLKESDYAAVYNYETYVALNPELQSAYGNDRNAILQHFVGHGMSEGRQASDEFNVYAYMNRYADLKAGFGNDLKGYYMHYINSGVVEGRNARVEEVVANKVESVLETELVVETGIELKPEVETEVETEVEEEVKLEVETEVEEEVKTETETKTEVEDESKVETELNTEWEVEQSESEDENIVNDTMITE